LRRARNVVAHDEIDREEKDPFGHGGAAREPELEGVLLYIEAVPQRSGAARNVHCPTQHSHAQLTVHDMSLLRNERAYSQSAVAVVRRKR
jgi:hypothetical protein